MNHPETFGQWLRRERKRRKLTQEGLGELAGMGRTYVIRLEKGTTALPRRETRAKFHAILGTSDQDLIDAGVFHIDPRTEEEIAGPPPVIIRPPTMNIRGEMLEPNLRLVNVSESAVLSVEESATVSITYDVKPLIDKILAVEWSQERIDYLGFTLDGWLELDRQRRTR